MKAGTHRIKFFLVLAVIMLAVLFTASQGIAMQGGDVLSLQEKRGRQIYLKGEGGEGGEIVAALGSDELEVPATSFACSNCHGIRGEGTKEGGLQPPPIDWETLTKPHTSALTRRERGPYNDTTLARAINAGLDPAGGPLHPGMPHYRMTQAQMSDLIAYLKKLGKASDTEPGITDDTIKIGAALPMSGPLAQVGEDVKATLEASFSQINSQGGIYGRRFQLVVNDSRAEPSQTIEATRRLIEQDGVFALISSFEPGESSGVNELLKSREVPLIGPITLSPHLTLPPNPYVFYLLPTFTDQARTLVDFAAMKAKGKPSRLAVVYAAGGFNQDALNGLKAQARLYGMEVALEQKYETGKLATASIIGPMAQKKPDYLFFFGGADDLQALTAEMERSKLNIPLLSSVLMIGRGAFQLPASVASQTFLSYPAILPNKDDFTEFLSLMQKANVALRHPAFQAVAFASTRIFFEALKSGSRQLDRPSLISWLEQIRDVRTGVIPPVTFGPNRRVGANGAYIVGIDLNNKQYVPLTDWLVPKDRP